MFYSSQISLWNSLSHVPQLARRELSIHFQIKQKTNTQISLTKGTATATL